MDVAPLAPKPRPKKEKSDKPKAQAEKSTITASVKPTSASTAPPNGLTTKTVPSGPSAPRQPPPPDTQKDLALPPKVVPSKRPSDASSAPTPRPEAKKPNFYGDLSKPTASSVPNRPNPNGSNPPKGLPRPAPPPGRPPPPPAAPPRAAEDVLFIKKKKVRQFTSWPG